MDGAWVFEKTADGEAAVNQRTRLVQRNLRTVLIMVDGTATVASLAAEIGNAALVDDALQQLLDEGLIRPRQMPEDVEVVEAEHQASYPAPSPTPPVTSIPNPFAATASVEPRAVSVEDEPFTAAHFKPVDVAALARAPVVAKPKLGPAAIAVGAGVAFVLLLLALILFHGAEQHRAAATAALGSALGGSATMGSLTTTGVPPTLVMRDVVVTVGERQASFDEIRAGLGLGVLFGADARLVDLTARGVRLDVGVLAALAAPGSRSAAGSVQQVRLQDASVSVGGIVVADLSGEVAFGADGTLVRAALRDGGEQWHAELTPAGGTVRLALTAGEIKGFPDKATTLNSVKFIGQLGADGYRIDEMDVRAFDGIIEGQAELNWRPEWRLNGALRVRQADLARLAAGLGSPLRVEGHANAALRFTAAAESPAALWAASQGDGQLEVGSGRVQGVDLVDAVRRAGGRGVIEGGETRFDNLTAAPRWRGSLLELTDLRLGAGLMSANGTLRMSDGALSGGVNVTVGGAATRIGGALAFTGTAREPAVRRQ